MYTNPTDARRNCHISRSFKRKRIILKKIGKRVWILVAMNHISYIKKLHLVSKKITTYIYHQKVYSDSSIRSKWRSQKPLTPYVFYLQIRKFLKSLLRSDNHHTLKARHQSWYRVTYVHLNHMMSVMRMHQRSRVCPFGPAYQDTSHWSYH